MQIRVAAPADETAVQRVIEAAFAHDEPTGEPVVEALLNDRLRRDPGYVPELTLVADRDGAVVGGVSSSYGVLVHPDPAVADRRILAIGPVSVRPDQQGRGVGSALVRAVIAAADAAGEPAIVLLGSPGFYGRFGFVTAADVGIEPPDPGWGEHFQVRTLATYSPVMTGRFRYGAPFDGV